MKNKLIIVLFTFLVACTPKSNNTTVFEITIQPSFSNYVARLQFSYTIKGSETGKTVLGFQNNSWGEQNLFNCIKGFTSKEANQIEILPDSNRIVLHHAPNSVLNINYMIQQDTPSQVQNKHVYRPIVQQTYFHAFGKHLFILPQAWIDESSKKREFLLNWKQFPADWIIQSSYGNSRKQHIKTSINELFGAIIIGGDFRSYHFELQDNHVYFLTRDKWIPFEDKEVFEILKQTVSSQRDFWSDHTDSLFTVTLLPTYEPWEEGSKALSYGGTGLHQSFASFCSNHKGATLEGIRWLYYHELFHNWVGNTIQNEAEEREYWFSEGFTNYYAYKFMLKDGFYDASSYLEAINTQILEPYNKSPVKTIWNNEITAEKFWSDYNYQQLPYQRGLLYALMIDSKIKQKFNNEKGLDELMRDLLAHVKQNPTAKFNASLFKEMLANYLDSSTIEQEFERYIKQGEQIDFKELISGIRFDTNFSISGDTTSTSNFLKQ